MTDKYMDAAMRQRTNNLNRQNVLTELPCWGHYHPARCARLGFVGQCPKTHSCKQETEKLDEYRFHELNFSRETINRLKGKK